MKTFTVQQVSQILNISPETVRRWIRGNKIKTDFVSRKSGHIITEAELSRFLKTMPKYKERFTSGSTNVTPALGLAALTGGILVGIIEASAGKKIEEKAIRAEEIQEYLSSEVAKLNDALQQKEILLHNTEKEISDIKQQINQYEQIKKSIE